MKYLRSVAKSDKLANKFEEKVPASKKLNSINITNKENISIEEVLKKRESKSKGDKGNYTYRYKYLVWGNWQYSPPLPKICQ